MTLELHNKTILKLAIIINNHITILLMIEKTIIVLIKY